MTRRLVDTGSDSTHPDIQYSSILNQGCDDESKITGYKPNAGKRAVVYICYCLTAFSLRLIFHWLPQWRVKATHDMCSLREASVVIVEDEHRQIFVHDIVMMTRGGTRLKMQRQSTLCPASCLANQHSVDESDKAIAISLSDSYLEDSLLRFFFHKKLKFVWSWSEERFNKLKPFPNTRCDAFHSELGLTESQAQLGVIRYGENRVHVPLTPVLRLFAEKALHPFYVFQVLSVILWYNDDYEMYATCILVISILSLSLSVFETTRNERALRSTLESDSEVTVCRDGSAVTVNSSSLTPGDAILLPKFGCTLQCDCALISGNCIVNESMLTGESVPVLKTPLPNEAEVYNEKLHARHTLYCGTKVIQTRFVESGQVKAVVTKVGFGTAKGDLVRSILFPKPVEFKFNRDIIHYLLVLASFAVLGFAYTLLLMVQRQYPAYKVLLRALDLVTIVVPPALPAAMTVGIVFAQNRLKSIGIFCISPNSINVSGALNVVCFDKTGTLTEDGLDLMCVLPSSGAKFESEEWNPKFLQNSELAAAMASCHSLTRIQGELSGDPLDFKMFQSSGWQLDEPEQVDYRKYNQLVSAVLRSPPGQNGDTELGIVRQFPFSSSLQRMSVIGRKLGDQHFTIYAKGAPETMTKLCKSGTIPQDFRRRLTNYTRRGFRVLALAYKTLDCTYPKVQKMSRDCAESDLIFLGLLVMENRLKEATRQTIQELHAASIRVVMVTGDNLLTALSVARDSGIVAKDEAVVLAEATQPEEGGAKLEFRHAGDGENELSMEQVERGVRSGRYHLAVSGHSWQKIRTYFPTLLPKLVVKGAIFGRFSPDQKSQLVEQLQSVGYSVGMCGDGANDCGALKSANSGISLSDAEASVASPFTSKVQDISCVPNLIREGRCALVTSFGTFKFMAAYSVTQFVSCLILYSIGSNLTDGQFLYIDLFLITSLGITFGYTKPHSRLSKQTPDSRLISPTTVTSLCCHTILAISFQTLAFLFVHWQPWFQPFSMDIMDDDYSSYENSAVFAVSSFQYIGQAVVFSKGRPFRRTVFSNVLLLVNVLVAIGVTIYVTVKPFDWLKTFLQLWEMPQDSPSSELKILFLSVALCNFLLFLLLERLIDSLSFRRFSLKFVELLRRCRRRRRRQMRGRVGMVEDEREMREREKEEEREKEKYLPEYHRILRHLASQQWPQLTVEANCEANCEANGEANGGSLLKKID